MAGRKPAKTAYDHIAIEKKWRKVWEEKGIYRASNASAKKKMYVLDMFPYPSGAGLHVGHPRGYIASDVYARMKRMQGYNVLHPMGFDSFGLPAEQYAIQTGKHPGPFTETLVKRYKEQLSILGFSYDWTREVATHRPDFYKWTQWIFLQLYGAWYDNKKGKARPIAELEALFAKSGTKGIDAACSKAQSFTAAEWKAFSKKEREDIVMQYRLAYEGYSEVNWCEELGTVLANDEIVDGPDGKPVSERGGYPVVKKEMRQWFMRITAYADRLLAGLEGLDWSPHIKEIQKNWIGKSEGAEIDFAIDGTDQTVAVFTTRPDTLFGATYVVLAPEHGLVESLKSNVERGCREKVEAYIEAVKAKTDADRTDAKKEKTGVRLEGVFAINPANGERIPVWIADYVLAGYGTGAVMAVPAHDERDFEFAKKYELPIKKVVAKETGEKRDNEEFRNGGAGIVFDPKTQKYAITEQQDGTILLLAGGVDDGEDIREGILREVREESGLHDYCHTEWIDVAHAHYFNPLKNVNRRARAECMLVILGSNDRKEVKLEDHEKFTLGWRTAEEIRNHWLEKNTDGGLDHYLRFLHEAVSRAIELGYDKESDKAVFRSTAMTEEGILENSGEFSGMDSEEAKKKIAEFVGGRWVAKYKMRDAIFARQRYWGEPIPLVHTEDGTIEPIPASKLPLELPKVKSYAPSGTGESPLASIKAWTKAGYETNTMPGWAGSSWYYIRYMDPSNKSRMVSEKAVKYWKDVDMYVGGQEHATGHLLYSRFWHKALKDLGHVPTEEPFKALRNQGMILGTDHRKMSKRWGNVINPDDVVKTHGADTMRVFECFIGPFDSTAPWSTDGIVGSRRFIERVWKLAERAIEERAKATDEEVLVALHKTIKKVTDDIPAFSFNTSVSAMMIFVNAAEGKPLALADLKKFLGILAPFAPHAAEELWHRAGETKSIHISPWPKYDPKKLVADTVTLAVQVNGKVRAEISVPADADEEAVKAAALAEPKVAEWAGGKEIKRFIYIKGRIANIVV